MYEAKILADSMAPCGSRLTTMQVTFPRIVLAEFNTHRMFSRNSASSRAIPVEKMLVRVQEDPFVPTYWGKNQKGMQADEELGQDEQANARAQWFSARDYAVYRVKNLQTFGVHKQIANRLLEPFLWHTVIVTATEWENFFALRCHKDAQPEIRQVAVMMRDLYRENVPKRLPIGWWHLPLVQPDELDALVAAAEALGPEHWRTWARISSARCARVSYLTHDGRRDVAEDLALADRLQQSGHMSPFEHAARAHDEPGMYGNFRGWVQYRKELTGEDVFAGAAP